MGRLRAKGALSNEDTESVLVPRLNAGAVQPETAQRVGAVGIADRHA